jgi:hypothetical protein
LSEVHRFSPLPRFKDTKKLPTLIITSNKMKRIGILTAGGKSDFDTSWAERPLMSVVSTEQLTVVVAMSRELSVKPLSFSRFVFIGLNHRKCGKTFVMYEFFLFGANCDPRVFRGIYHRRLPALEALDLN